MEKQPSSRTCFLCGRENDFALKIDWYSDPENEEVVADFSIPEHFNGYPGIAHGGIVSAVLDETAGRAILLNGFEDNFTVTMKLEVTFRKPTPTQSPLKAVGRILETRTGVWKVGSEIRLPDGQVTAECVAYVVRPPAEVDKKIKEETPHWYVEPD